MCRSNIQHTFHFRSAPFFSDFGFRCCEEKIWREIQIWRALSRLLAAGQILFLCHGGGAMTTYHITRKLGTCCIIAIVPRRHTFDIASNRQQPYNTMHRLLCLALTAVLASLHGVCDAFVTNHHGAVTKSTNSKLQSQILDFIEPSTGVEVKLIGAMHYNPASIQLATDTINQLEKEGKLGSIIIESSFPSFSS